MKKYLITALLSILVSAAFIQLNAQENPRGISWKYIEAGKYRIIFPSGMEKTAQRTAYLMIYYEKYNYESIKTTPSFIPIVIINNITDPNGFVSPAPFYSHWFTTPSSFSSTEWFRTLAIHEGRHMVQMNKMKDGPGKKTWSVLFGDAGSAVFQALYIPVWFMEGDAVNMETALTWGGRGRLPGFTLWHRTLELSGTRYSYYRSYLGSFNDLYPYSDYYSLGYLLSTYVRTHYGKDIWDRVLDNTGRYILLHNFDRSVEIETGKSVAEIYRDALNEYSLLWKSQLSGLKLTDADFISPVREGKWDSYFYPYPNGNNSAAAIHFSRDSVPSLVKITGKGKPEIITRLPMETLTPAFMSEKSISAAEGKILWREKTPDCRWGYRNYSNLKIYDTATGESKTLTTGGKYIAAALSADGNFAAGVEYTPELKYYINIIKTDNGELLRKTDVTETGYIYDPALSEDGKSIAFASLTDRGNRLLIYNIESETFETVIDYTRVEQIKAPQFYKEYIIYGSQYSGIDNIYAVHLNSRKKYQITSRPYGAYYPSVSTEDKTLYFNDYSINGYRAASMKLDPAAWTPIEKVVPGPLNDIRPIVEQELPEGLPDDQNIPQKEYTVKNYYPALNLVNIYGWFPGFNSSANEFYFSVLSRDILHTSLITASYIRNFNENTNAGEISAIYSGFFPVFSLTGGYGERTVIPDKDESDSENYDEYVKWREARAATGISLPLNFSRGRHKTFFNAAVSGGIIRITDKSHENIYIYQDMNEDGMLSYINYAGSFSHIMENNLNAVAPRMGQILTISYSDSLESSDYKGSLLSGSLIIYIPGLFSSHSIKLSGSVENLNYKNYAFQSGILFPRGYDEIRHELFTMAGIDYSFPIINMSANIWELTYIRRINGALFFDYGRGETGDNDSIYPSAGVELTVRHNLLANIYLDIETGLRYSRCFETDDNRFDFVIKSPM